MKTKYVPVEVSDASILFSEIAQNVLKEYFNRKIIAYCFQGGKEIITSEVHDYFLQNKIIEPVFITSTTPFYAYQLTHVGRYCYNKLFSLT